MLFTHRDGIYKCAKKCNLWSGKKNWDEDGDFYDVTASIGDTIQIKFIRVQPGGGVLLIKMSNLTTGTYNYGEIDSFSWTKDNYFLNDRITKVSSLNNDEEEIL